MNTQQGFEKYATYINCQLQPGGKPLAPRGAPPWRAVTISREAGAGGHTVAEKLAGYLQRRTPAGACPWTVFDRNLVEKVLEDHNLPQSLARFMPEDRITESADVMDELFGLHPPSWTLVRKTSETILHLAELGNVILIGRGANIITSKLDYVFHVRLVASLEKRLATLQEYDHLSRKAALEFIREEDRGRRRYVKKYFNKDITDPLLYHLVLNTDLVSFDEAARMIGEATLASRV